MVALADDDDSEARESLLLLSWRVYVLAWLAQKRKFLLKDQILLPLGDTVTEYRDMLWVLPVVALGPPELQPRCYHDSSLSTISRRAWC